MEYIQEDQILLYEELCGYPIREDELSIATIRFRENIRLANCIASKFSTPYDAALDKEDVLQLAYLGLWEACLKFDDNKGFKFTTYAVPMIKGRILHSLRDSGVLKTPRWFKDIRSALNKHGFTLPLTDQEVDILINEGKFSREQIIEYADIDIISLDSTLKEDSEITYGEIIPDRRNLESELNEDEIEYIIDSVVSYIKPEYRDLVEEWIYSVLADCSISQKTLATKYKCSRAQVCKVVNSAISIISMHKEEIRSLFGL